MYFKANPALVHQLGEELAETLNGVLRSFCADKGTDTLRLDFFIRNQERVDAAASTVTRQTFEPAMRAELPKKSVDQYRFLANYRTSAAARDTVFFGLYKEGKEGEWNSVLSYRLQVLDVLGLHWQVYSVRKGQTPQELPCDIGPAFRNRALHIAESNYVQTFFEFFKTHDLGRLFPRGGPLVRAARSLFGGLNKDPYRDYVLLSAELLEYFDLARNPFVRESLGIVTRSVYAEELDKSATRTAKFLAATADRGEERNGIDSIYERHFIDARKLLGYLVVGLFSIGGIALPDDISAFIGDLLRDYRRNEAHKGLSFSEFLKKRLVIHSDERTSIQVVVVAPTDTARPLVLLQDNLRKRRSLKRDWKDWKLVSRRLDGGAEWKQEDEEKRVNELLASELGLGEKDFTIPSFSIPSEMKASKRTRSEIVKYTYRVSVVHLTPNGARKLYDAFRASRATVSGTRSFRVPGVSGYRYTWASLASVLSNSVVVAGGAARVASSARKILANLDIDASVSRIEKYASEIPVSTRGGSEFYPVARVSGRLVLRMNYVPGDSQAGKCIGPLQDNEALMTITKFSASEKREEISLLKLFFRRFILRDLVPRERIVERVKSAIGNDGCRRTPESAYVAQSNAKGPVLEFLSFCAVWICCGQGPKV